MSAVNGLEQFAHELHPKALADIRSWSDHPVLGALYAALSAHTHRKTFFDVYAEAMAARHLIQHGCDLRIEVPTPRGKACDFEVRKGDAMFYLHVKRADTERGDARRLSVSSRLRSLERLQRPYVVGVRWRPGADDEQMQRIVQSATSFIMHARVGDELVVHDDHGRELGGVMIVAPWEGDHVSLVIGLPDGFINEALRMKRLMKRAYLQFMPRAENVILVCSAQRDDRDDVEAALLGAHVERWDAFPRRGQRIAHGRAEDGLWHERRYAESKIAGWVELAPSDESLNCRLWRRPGMPVEPKADRLISELFDMQ